MGTSLTTLVLLTAALLGLVAPASAYDLDETRWNQDMRNILRLEAVSAKLRAEVRSFAAEHQGVEALSGQQNHWVDGVVDAYARIRGHLEAIEARWEDAFVARGELAGERPARARGTLAYLGAATVLIENAAAMVDSFDNTLWEWRLNRATLTKRKVRVSGMFDDMWDTLCSARGRAAITERLAWLQAEPSALDPTAKGAEPIARLMALVAGSEEVAAERPRTLLQRAKERIGRRLDDLDTWFSRAIIKLSHQLATKLEGDPYSATVAAKVAKKSRQPASVTDDLAALLRPGDVLVCKNAGSLVDMLIPGYFGHCALWLGSYDELVELGAFDSKRNRWSQEKAEAHRSHLMEGRSVCEALFPGVLLNDLSHTVCESSIAVLRLKQRAIPAGRTRLDVTREVVFKALSHVDKDYDFWFNVNTPGTIVCSELVYQAYPDFVKWPTCSMVGRPTVSPDNVAVMAGPTDEFPFEVLYYTELGTVVRGADAWRPFWKYLKAEGDLYDPASSDAARLGKMVESVQP